MSNVGHGAIGPGPPYSDERWGSRSNPSLNGHLHDYPTDIDRTLNETSDDKVIKYRRDDNNRPSMSRGESWSRSWVSCKVQDNQEFKQKVFGSHDLKD